MKFIQMQVFDKEKIDLTIHRGFSKKSPLTDIIEF